MRREGTGRAFIDAASGRLAKPGVAQGDRSSGPSKSENVRRGGGNGGNSDDPGEIDPIIAGLLKRLPKSGDVWPESERKLWVDLLAGSFKLIYKDKPPSMEEMLK